MGQFRAEPSALAGHLFSTRKSRSEVPERGGFGEENCPEKGGVDKGEKKKEKRMRKERWVANISQHV